MKKNAWTNYIPCFDLDNFDDSSKIQWQMTEWGIEAKSGKYAVSISLKDSTSKTSSWHKSDPISSKMLTT
jgi:hypothetical protein